MCTSSATCAVALTVALSLCFGPEEGGATACLAGSHMSSEWKLAVTIDSNSYDTWKYDSPYWTNTEHLDTGGNVKNANFFEKSNAIRVEITGGATIEYRHNLDKSLHDIFAAGGFIRASISKSNWTRFVPNAGLQRPVSYTHLTLPTILLV